MLVLNKIHAEKFRGKVSFVCDLRSNGSGKNIESDSDEERGSADEGDGANVGNTNKWSSRVEGVWVIILSLLFCSFVSLLFEHQFFSLIQQQSDLITLGFKGEAKTGQFLMRIQGTNSHKQQKA